MACVEVKSLAGKKAYTDKQKRSCHIKPKTTIEGLFCTTVRVGWGWEFYLPLLCSS